MGPHALTGLKLMLDGFILSPARRRYIFVSMKFRQLITMLSAVIRIEIDENPAGTQQFCPGAIGSLEIGQRPGEIAGYHRVETAGRKARSFGVHYKKLCGDVDFEKAEPVVDAITPVPGGVGSVTTSVLVGHVVEAAKRKFA